MSERMMDASTRVEMSSGSFETRQSLLDRPIASLISVNWEMVAWLLLFVVGGVARFYHLGVRAMSHDESLHALYSYYLYNAGNYEHNPMMHGPLRFHVNALMYFLFGDSDTTARIAPALAGLGVMAMALLFRRYIGRMGALMAGVMVTISPSLLFHSRYIRDDIFISLFTMVWIYGAMRYMDARSDTGTLAHRTRWLGVMVLGMALGFVTMENHFIHGALLGAFFAGLALWQVIGRDVYLAAAVGLLAGSGSFYFFELGQTGIALAIAGIGIVIAVGLLVRWLMGTPWSRLRRNDAADLAVMMATAVMPFLAPFGHLIFGWDAMAYATTTDLMRSAGLVLVMAAISVSVGYYWFGMRSPAASGEGTLTFGQWAQMMGMFWLIQVLFFTTFLTNTRNGLASGIVGSLGYWLAQHEVQRGGQPWYYYLMLGSLYEFLPLLLTLGGAATVLIELRRNSDWDPVIAADLPANLRPRATDLESDLLRRNRVYFIVLALWWSLGTWLAYTVAGEKMPWLLTHIALPMCVVGGWWIGRVIR